jgi:hypothetical protein
MAEMGETIFYLGQAESLEYTEVEEPQKFGTDPRANKHTQEIRLRCSKTREVIKNLSCGHGIQLQNMLLSCPKSQTDRSKARHIRDQQVTGEREAKLHLLEKCLWLVQYKNTTNITTFKPHS